MPQYLIKRTGQAVFTLFCVLTFAFILGRATGKPAGLLLPDSATAAEVDALNGALGFIMIVTFCFAIQSVEEQIIMSSAPYPFVEVFATATGSTAAAIGMTVPMVLMTLSMCINSTAAASRQAWSFARDDGLPFPRWFTRLVPINSTPLPINAMVTSFVILIVVALLNFGGSEVFNSIIGLMTGAVGLTYALSIGCVLWRRLYGEPLPPARWSLGRWAVPVNIIAVLYEVFSTVISFFPLFAKVDAKGMNWGMFRLLTDR